MAACTTYDLPHGIPRADDLAVVANGQLAAIGRTPICDYAVIANDGALICEIMASQPITQAVVRPASAQAECTFAGGRLFVRLVKSRQLTIEIPGRPVLHLSIQSVASGQPTGTAERVRRLAAGHIHNLGEVVLGDGEELHIEGGAVMRGWVRSTGTRGACITGHGIIDTSTLPFHFRRLIILDGCRDALVRGITTIGSPVWTLVIGGCEDVRVTAMNQIGWHISTDGVDICGSRRVTVEDCFLRNNDDNIAIKAIAGNTDPADLHGDWCQDVEDILVQRCICWNDRAGNVFEIGFETRCAVMRRITFRDCDVIGAHGEGGVFTIHNGDRAVVEDVLYQDIRIEHFYDKFIDFRVLSSRYSHEGGQGRIRRIRLERIRAIEDLYNTVSLIGGMSPETPVEEVTFVDVRFGERVLLNPDDLHLFVKNATQIAFRIT